MGPSDANGKDKPMDRRESSTKASIRHQLSAGRWALLAMAGLTVINQLMLLWGAEYHFWLAAAVPYYVNWFWVKLELSGIWPVALVLLSLALDGFFFVCWALSRRRRIFLTAALAGYALDTLLLVIFAFTLLRNPASCILEIGCHLAVVYLLMTAEQASGALQRMRQRRPRLKERECV